MLSRILRLYPSLIIFCTILPFSMALADHNPTLLDALSDRADVTFGESFDAEPNNLILPFAGVVQGGMPDGELEDQTYFELGEFYGHSAGSLLDFEICGEIAGHADLNKLVYFKNDAETPEIIFIGTDAAGATKSISLNHNDKMLLALTRDNPAFTGFSLDSRNPNNAVIMLAQKVIQSGVVNLPRSSNANNPPVPYDCEVKSGDVILHIEDLMPGGTDCASGSDCDYNDMVVVVRELGKLLLTSMCSDNPALKRRWRVRNSNNFDLEFDYEVVGTDQQGTHTAPANSDFFFYTDAVEGPNTTKISVDGVTHNTKASGGASCAELSVSTECTGAAEVTFTITATDGSLLNTHGYTVSDSEGVVKVGVLPALSSGNFHDIVAMPASSPYSGVLTLEIETLGITETSVMFEDFCGDLDCAGNPGGNAELDDQGACCLQSEQGICDGLCFSEDDSCVDCAGIPFGDSLLDAEEVCCTESDLDQCEVCFGDGTSCLQCESIDITSTLFVLDSNALEQSRLVRRGARIAVRNGAPRNFRRRVVQQANALYEESWNITWSIPQVIDQCQNAQFCVEVSNATPIASYNDNSETLRNLARRTVRRARRASGNPQIGRRILRIANRQHLENLELIGTVPASTSSCTTSGGTQEEEPEFFL